MQAPRRVKKSDRTRESILGTALGLFRKNGFEETTMREIADAAGMSLGSTYYYFESKEAIVAAYYDYVQSEYAIRAAAALSGLKDFRSRLAAVLNTKLDILKDDRKILSGLFRYGGNPGHELSWFGPGTEHIRRSTMAVMEDAASVLKLPADMRQLSPTLLWVLEMGLLLYFTYDNSPGQRRTRRLVDGASSLANQLVRLIAFPMARGARTHAMALLRDANLLPRLEVGT
jgi:AcrR family transcriptional regulator